MSPIALWLDVVNRILIARSRGMPWASATEEAEDMTKVFKYYVIKHVSGQWLVNGYDDPSSADPPVFIDEFLSEAAAKAAFPKAIREDVWLKPWQTRHGLRPAIDE